METEQTVAPGSKNTTATESKYKQLKSKIENLMNDGVFDFGSIIPNDIITSSFELNKLTEAEYNSMTLKHIRKRIESDTLVELNVIGMIRNILLNEGRYITKIKENYRVCLPSENYDIAEKYFNEGNRKFNKARRLLKNSRSEISTHDKNSLLNKLQITNNSSSIH